MKTITLYFRLLLLLLFMGLFSCTKERIGQSDDPILGKGYVELSVQVLGQQENIPQTKHGIPRPGTFDESNITTLHVFVFNTATGTQVIREVISINADGSATNAITGAPHPMWNSATRRLRVKLYVGDKNICAIANWPTGAAASGGFPVIRDITTMDDLRTIVRGHNATIGYPVNSPVMYGFRNVTITGNETEISIEMERQIARVDLHPAISQTLLTIGAKVKILGVRFKNIAGSSFLTPHFDGATPPQLVSPTTGNTLWEEPNFGGTPMIDNMIETDPSNADKFGTFYLPEHISTDEASASEMIIRAEYNGVIYYYGIKLHNGIVGPFKRYWVERNHWYRYNITITGRGSDDETKPSYDDVAVGVNNKDWEAGESTNPGFIKLDLPSNITAMHFKGVSRFVVNLPKGFNVDSDVDWITAHHVDEGGVTYIEIITRTNNTGGNRDGNVFVVMANGLQHKIAVTQNSEGNSIWVNRYDATTWYRANVGAARLEDPGFLYQWGSNKALSIYTPKLGAPQVSNPLVSYGVVNWSEIPQIFPLDAPVTTWNNVIDSNNDLWQAEKDPCPSGYRVPTSTQANSLFGASSTPPLQGDNLAWGEISGVVGVWLNGTPTLSPPVSTPTGVFFPHINVRDVGGSLSGSHGSRYWFSGTLGANSNLAFNFTFILRSSIFGGSFSDKRLGAPVRCVKAGNIRYDGNGHTSGVVPTDHVFYADGSTVVVKPHNLTKTGYEFTGWAVIKPNGDLITNAVSGDTFVYPADAEYVTIKATWIKQFTVTFDKNGKTAMGEMEPVTFISGAPFTLPANTFLSGISDWEFIGWNEYPYLENAQYLDKETVTFVDRDVTLYAIWKQLNFFVTYVSNTGREPKKARVGDVYPIPTTPPSTASLAFKYWSTQPNGQGTKIVPGQTVFTGIDLEIYAHYEIINLAISINYYGNGATYGVDKSQTATKNQAVRLLEKEFFVPGSTFDGWSTSPNGERVYLDNQVVTLSASINLYARWVRLKNVDGSDLDVTPEMPPPYAEGEVEKNWFWWMGYPEDYIPPPTMPAPYLRTGCNAKGLTLPSKAQALIISNTLPNKIAVWCRDLSRVMHPGYAEAWSTENYYISTRVHNGLWDITPPNSASVVICVRK